MGEFGCRAVLAGSFAVPTVFISGDDKTVAEARALIPGIYGAAVKQGRGIEMAIHLSPQQARELIRQVASDATRHRANIAPLVLDPPYEQEIRVLRNVDVSAYQRRANAEQLDERTFRLCSSSLCDLMI
jgi:D-amino peptidase